MALLLVVGLRMLSGLVQLIEELGREYTISSALGRFLAPVGSTMGILVFGASLLGVLSPTGSVDPRLKSTVATAAAIVAVLGVVSVVNSFSLGFSVISSRIWFALIEPLAATMLGGTGWWLHRSLDPDR